MTAATDAATTPRSASGPVGPLRRVLRLVPVPRWSLVAAVAAGAGAAGCAVALLATSGFLLSRAALHPPVLELMVAIVAVRAFGLGRGVLRYLERLATHDAALRLLGEVRVRFYERLEPLAPGGLETHHRADLLARVVGDVETLQALMVRGVVPPLVALAVSVPAVAVAWWLAPAAGLALAAGLLVAGAALPALAVAAARREGARQAHTRGEQVTGVVEVVQGAPELLAAGRLEEHLEGLRATDRKLAGLARRDAWVTAAVTGAGVLVAGATMWLTLASGVRAVAAGALDGVLLATAVLLVMAAFETVAPLAVTATQTGVVRAAANRLFDVTDAVPPVSDPPAPRDLPVGAAAVTLEAVSLRYDADGPLVLDGVDLALGPGRRVALVGPSGAGKSTLAEVLLRFREPHAGRYTVGGVDVRELRQDDVRGVVGLAGQDAHLFDATVAENVRLARPGASDAEVTAVLARVQLSDWVATLPDGLRTRVGERGAWVSGGQRQRIALARVLLADNPVVVLDEPMANLDAATADALLADVLAATAGRALLLVTHRLAGLAAFDEIVVLDEGRVVERGAHARLVAADGLYRRLWDLEEDAAAAASASNLRADDEREGWAPPPWPASRVSVAFALKRLAGARASRTQLPGWSVSRGHPTIRPEMPPNAGSARPSMRARIMSRPDAPITSEATVASFTPASSSVLWMRFTSRERSLISALR